MLPPPDGKSFYRQQCNDLMQQFVLQTHELTQFDGVSQRLDLFWTKWVKIHEDVIVSFSDECLSGVSSEHKFELGCADFLKKRRGLSSALLQALVPWQNKTCMGELSRKNELKDFDVFKEKLRSFLSSHDALFGEILSTEKEKLSLLLKNAMHGRDAVSAYAKVKSGWRL